MSETLVGTVTHYYSRIGVAAVDLRDALSKGDRIHFLGHTTELYGLVDSMEINHDQIDRAKPGDDVAIKVSSKVRSGDKVFIRSTSEESPEV